MSEETTTCSTCTLSTTRERSRLPLLNLDSMSLKKLINPLFTWTGWICLNSFLIITQTVDSRMLVMMEQIKAVSHQKSSLICKRTTFSTQLQIKKIRPLIRTNRSFQSEKTKSYRLLKISGRGRFLRRLSEEKWLKGNYSLIRMVILTLPLRVSNFQLIMNPKWEVNSCRQSKMFMDCRTQSKEQTNNSSRPLSYLRMVLLTSIILV